MSLPGRASAAAAALAVVLEPLLSALSGRGEAAEPVTGMLSERLPAGPGTRLLPAVVERSELVLDVHPMPWHGPAGMHALAAADALVVLEAHHSPGDTIVALLPLPGVLLG